MHQGLLLRYPDEGWASGVFAGVHPGAHVGVFGGPSHALHAEDAGFEVRDCLTVLGPVYHRVWLFRRPLETTVVAQMLSTGTGGLWVDGCRVAGDLSEFVSATTGKPRSGMGHAHGYAMGDGYGGDKANPPHPGGRWPANLVLMHTPECRKDGMKKVKTGVITKACTRSNVGGYAGLETVTAWQCSPQCCIPTLDTQSGMTASRVLLTPSAFSSRGSNEGWKREAHSEYKPTLRGHADAGGASRFFPQFGSESELDTWLTNLILGPG